MQNSNRGYNVQFLRQALETLNNPENNKNSQIIKVFQITDQYIYMLATSSRKDLGIN